MSTEEVYNKLSNFFNQSINTVTSLVKVLLKSRFREELFIADYESCIIFGNGLSLKISLSKCPEIFTKQSLICVNSFSITEEYVLLKPKYYVIFDTLDRLKKKTTWWIQIYLFGIASRTKRFVTLFNGEKKINLNCFNYSVIYRFSSKAYFFVERIW